MNEWPEGWFRDGGGAGGPSRPPGAAGPGEPTAHVPGPGYGAGAGRSPGSWGASASARPGSGSAWPEQPPVHSARGSQRAVPRTRPGGGGRGAGSAGGGGRWLRPRRIFAIIALLLVVVIVGSVGMYLYVNSKLVRADVLTDYAGRPAPGAGTNWLITGSDSRQGLTRKQELQLATGKLSAISGHRSDTILILHIPSNGLPATLVSVPRDSYVPIPGHGSSKINAAYDFGGAPLLAQTLQNVTGLYINHYMGIGFGGFVNVVDAVGGVNMCLPGPMKDPKAGLNLKAGCQTLDGAQALGYVRTRNFAISDLQREQDQRLFMKALLSKMTSPSVILNPFKALPAASGSASSLTVDQGANLYDLIKAAFALKSAQTTTVPIATADYQTSDGVAVLWDRSQALRLFHALKNDKPVPRRLITGSKAAPTA
jgi:LCP family protein required for cell wall assembly